MTVASAAFEAGLDVTRAKVNQIESSNFPPAEAKAMGNREGLPDGRGGVDDGKALCAFSAVQERLRLQPILRGVG